MSALETPREMICDSRWLCKTRRTKRASAHHYCECGGLLHPLGSERGLELTAMLHERMASSPRLRRIHGMTQPSKPREATYSIGSESPDYVPNGALSIARR